MDVDEDIFTVIIIGSDGHMSEIYSASDSDPDKPKIETIILALNIKFYAATSEKVESLLGYHKWDVLEYDKLKFIKIYPSGDLEHKMVVVIAASTKKPIDVVESVIGYMNDPETGTPVQSL